MSSFGKGPNKKKKVPLTEGERNLLHLMYRDQGAWTHQEALTRLGAARFQELMRAGVIGPQSTDMGVMYHLLARGRASIYKSTDVASSLLTQLDQAYVRLCMAERKWEFTEDTSPFYKGLAKLFPGLNGHFREGYTEFGSSLISGKITGGGYSPRAIAELGNRLRSEALSRNFRLVIFTPSRQRGQLAAEPLGNILKLVPHRPDTGDASKRFFILPRQPSPTEPGPYLTHAKIKALRDSPANTLPEQTLKVVLQKILQAALRDSATSRSLAQGQSYPIAE